MKESQYPFNMKHLEDNPGFLLWKVTGIWQQKQKRELEEKHNISHSQYVILASIFWLRLHEEEVTQVILSHYTKIEPMTVSVILKGLQKTGYIFRQPHPIDTRAKVVYLTEEGKEFITDVITSIEAIDRNFFKALGKGISNFNSELIKLIKING